MALKNALEQKIVNRLIDGRCVNVVDFIDCFRSEFEKELSEDDLTYKKDNIKSIFWEDGADCIESALPISLGGIDVYLKADVLNKDKSESSVELAISSLESAIYKYVGLTYYLESLTLIKRRKIWAKESGSFIPSIGSRLSDYIENVLRPLFPACPKLEDIPQTKKVCEEWELLLFSLLSSVWYDEIIPMPTLATFRDNKYFAEIEVERQREKEQNERVLFWTRVTAIAAMVTAVAAIAIPSIIGYKQLTNTQEMRIKDSVRVEINADSLARAISPIIHSQISANATKSSKNVKK